MHQAQWSPERPLPPPLSLASQSHHEKPPEVTCTIEGTQAFLPQPEKDLQRPSSTRLQARFPYHGSGAMTRFGVNGEEVAVSRLLEGSDGPVDVAAEGLAFESLFAPPSMLHFTPTPSANFQC